MPVVSAVMVPHPPLIVPGGWARRGAKCIVHYRSVRHHGEVFERFAAGHTGYHNSAQPVLASMVSHTLRRVGKIAVLRRSERRVSKISADYDTEFTLSALRDAAVKAGLQVDTSAELAIPVCLTMASMVPLYFGRGSSYRFGQGCRKLCTGPSDPAVRPLVGFRACSYPRLLTDCGAACRT